MTASTQTSAAAPSGQAEASAEAPELRKLHRWGTWVLVLGLVAAVLWMALAPLDEGVPTQAVVAIDTKRKTIQHLQGGLIREIKVREGDVVQEGQVLMRLDDAVARSNLEAIRQRYLGLRAMESRLLAEQQGLDRISFHPDVLREAGDPLIQRHIQSHQQVLATRRAGLAADLQAIEESIRGQDAVVRAYEGMSETRKSQRQLLQEQLQNIRGLVQEGYAPRNQQLDLERQLGDINSAIADLHGNIARGRQAIAELRQRALSRRQDYRKESDTQLADVTREVQADAVRLQALREELDRTEIRSPVRGQVVGLAFQTVGGVIPPGQRVMDIVPEGQSLILEARILPHLANAVETGNTTDVRFSAFAHAPQMVAEGKVISLSGDLLSEQTPMGPMSFYLARIELTPAGMKTLGTHQMQPGMPAEVIIKTGERTVLTYLLHPLTRRVASAMKER